MRHRVSFGIVGGLIALSSALVAGCRDRHATISITTHRAAHRDDGAVRAAPPRMAPAAEITAERFLTHVEILAHDALEGRDTGTDGIDLAAGYIAGRFAADGVLPGGDDGSYFQRFTAPGRAELLPATALSFSGVTGAAELHEDFRPFAFSTQGEFAGEVVFAGYGVSAAEEDHDDYRDLDVTGRVVLMLRRQPAWLGDRRDVSHARFATKVGLAREKGAAAVLIVNQRPDEGGSDRLMPFRASRTDYGIPALHITRELGDALLAAGGLRGLDVLQDELDETGSNASAPLAGVRAKGNVAVEVEELTARNVIGLVLGTGPAADEYVVIGGHYDHLGVRRGEIYNGADDNASGTAGIIESCRAMARTPQRNRSVLCIAFSGEERGLLGSRHYCEEPTVPMEAIKAILNMDMIGRVDHDAEANMLAIQGLGTGLSFQRIVDHRAREAGIPYLPDPSARAPSDHAVFYQGGVPALFFFTGIHEDYHQPGDDTPKVNAEGGAQITRLVYAIARDLVDGDEPPVYAQVDQPARIMRGAAPTGGGVVLGIMPDLEDESGQKGWRVAEVFSGSGAARAGIQPGDRILLIEGREINSLGDYREVTRDKKPGDRVAITILRKSERMVLDVELQARGQAGRSAPSPGSDG